MAVRCPSRGPALLLGPAMLGTLLLAPLAACQSSPPPVQAAAPAPAPPPPPVRTAARPRPRRTDATCLTTERKQALFRQFAAMQDGDGTELALAADTTLPGPAPQPPCKPGEK